MSTFRREQVVYEFIMGLSIIAAVVYRLNIQLFGRQSVFFRLNIPEKVNESFGNSFTLYVVVLIDMRCQGIQLVVLKFHLISIIVRKLVTIQIISVA